MSKVTTATTERCHALCMSIFVFFEQGAHLLDLVHGKWLAFCFKNLNCQEYVWMNAVHSCLIFLSVKLSCVSWGIKTYHLYSPKCFLFWKCSAIEQSFWTALTLILMSCNPQSGKNVIYCSHLSQRRVGLSILLNCDLPEEILGFICWHGS